MEEVMKRWIRTTLELGLIGVLISCSSDEIESRSMEQIYREEGVPVRVKNITPEPFAVELMYHAVLTGIEESAAYAGVGEKVEKVNVGVGDYVNKDDILLVFPTNSPDAQFFQAKVAYDNAKLAYERIANMYQTGGIAKQQLDNARASFEVAAANWDAAQKSVMVKAPISGYVTKVNVRESDNVKKEAELFTISRMDQLKARVWISEQDISYLSPGMHAYARWQDAEIKGKVVQVDMALDQIHQAFGADLVFDNHKKIKKFGITADIFIEVYKTDSAIVADVKDLLREGDRYYVYTVENDRAARKFVSPGRQNRLRVEILEGISPGEQLIIEGQMLLVPDAKIRIIE